MSKPFGGPGGGGAVSYERGTPVRLHAQGIVGVGIEGTEVGQRVGIPTK